MTAKIPYSDPLSRKGWVRKGLAQMASRSFWSPLTGMSKDSIVYQANLSPKNEGHVVTFDYSGNVVAKGIAGAQTAYGKGVEKRKFSDTLQVEQILFPVDNGRKFDGAQIGDLAITEHADSMAKLADAFTRFKDQTCFDAVQGVLKDRRQGVAQTSTHIITATSLTYDVLQEIARKVNTGTGFDTGDTRARMKPYMWQGKFPKYLFVIDPFMAEQLRKDSKFQTLVASADLRGSDNRVTSGILGQIGRLVIVEADVFKGESESHSGLYIDQTEVEESGLRRYDEAGRWTGEVGFDSTDTLKSRGVVLGAGAVEMAFGMQPDYHYQPSTNFGTTSESALEVWMETKKCKLDAATQDYTDAKIANLDYGVIAVDVTTS